jgi:CheY-like chemotaxis protein
MFIPSDEQQLFVTLIAYEPSALQILQLQDISGSTFVLATTPDETTAAIANKLFNLIIIDLDFNGFEIVSLAKNPSCINCNTPIIALTDNVDSGLRKSLIAAGFDDCLLKPLTVGSLNGVIRLWLRNDITTSSLQAIQALLTKCNNNRSLVLTLYKKLFEELPLQIIEVEHALSNDDQYQMALDITHKLNGSAKICCLQDIGEWADALEKCLIQKQYPEVNGNFMMLQQRISTFVTQRTLILGYLGSLIDKQQKSP